MITIVGSGGGGGLCNFNWGSHSAGEDTVLKNIQDLIRHHGWQYDDGYRDI
jgi:hypothetical protein